MNISKNPSSKLFARNPMAFVLQSNSYVVPTGTPNKPQVVIEWVFPNHPADGDSIIIYSSLSWPGSLILNFVSSSPGANELTAYAGQGYVAYLQQLKQELQQHYIIGTFFTVETYETGVEATVILKKTDDYIINAVGGAGTYSITKNNTTAPTSYLQNFSFLLELFIEESYRSGVYGRKIQYTPLPDNNSRAEVYINKALLDNLTVDLPQSPNTGEKVRLCGNIHKRWWARVTEVYGDPPVQQPWATSRKWFGYALKAGLSDVMYSDSYTAPTGVNANKFLTRCPEKVVREDQPEWLYFRRDDANINKVAVKLYYEDGTTETGFKPVTLANMDAVSQADDVVCIEAGYLQLEMDVKSGPPNNKQIVSWEIQLLDSGDNLLYKPFRYYLEQTPRRFVRYFVFQNSQGGMDTMRCEGKIEKELEVEKQFAVTSPGYDYSLPERLYSGTVYSDITTYTISTGHITRAYADYLEELMRSDYVYAWRNDRFEPVALLGGSYPLPEDEGLYSREFQYRAGYEEDIYWPYADESDPGGSSSSVSAGGGGGGG